MEISRKSKGGIKLSSRFKQFYNKMAEKIREKRKKYKTSWLEAPLMVLRARIVEEYLEWNRASKKENIVREMEELVDLANQCMLLWIRLRQLYELDRSYRQVKLLIKELEEEKQNED